MRMASRPSGCSLSRNLIFHQITNLTTEDTEGTETKPFLPISEVGVGYAKKPKNPKAPQCSRCPLRLSFQLLQNFSRGVGAGGTGQTVSGMRSRAAKVQPPDRRAVARPVQQRAHGENLVQRQLTVENVAASQAVGFFQIFWGDNLTSLHQARQVGGVFRQRVHHRIAQGIALSVPVRVPQLIWR